MRAVFTSLLSILLMWSLQACGQGTIKVRSLEATVSLGEHLSLREAQRKGEQQLKAEALRRAGIDENVQSYESLMQFESGQNLDQIYTSDIQTEIGGVVSKLEITDLQRRINMANEFEIVMKANAEVKRSKGKSDPNFTMRVEGLRNHYQNGDAIRVYITPSQDAYVQLFLIGEDNQAYRLYPNFYEGNEPVNAQRNNVFPRRSVDYKLATTHTDHEFFRLVILLSKESIALPFAADPDNPREAPTVDARELLVWIYGIDQGERRLYFQTFKVERN